MIKILPFVLCCFISGHHAKPFNSGPPAFIGSCHCIEGCEKDLSCLSGGCRVGWSGKYCQREKIGKRKFSVDGSPDSNTTHGDVKPQECLTIESYDQQSLWKMELEGTDTAVSVLEFHLPRTDKEVLLDLEIYVDDSLCYKHDQLTVLDEDNTVPCLEALNGTTITFSLPLTPSNLVNICDVKAYGCAAGMYGELCEKTCNCLNSRETCDSVTGRCDSGCMYGFYSPNCDKSCDAGFFGSNCSLECGHCENQTCDSTTGMCGEAGCQPYWTGSYCDYCINYFYGPNCTSSCGHCRFDQMCDFASGECYSGCEPGYHGPTCLEECPPHNYGLDCADTCGNCSNGESCDVKTGVCVSGCLDGYMPPLCQRHDAVWSQTNIIILCVCLVFTVILSSATIVLILARRRKKKLNVKSGRENSGFDNHTSGYDSDEDDEIRNTDISMSDLKPYIDKRMAHDEFIIEFRKLPTGSHVKHLQASTRDNKSKNRFLSIYPYDHSRVKLPSEEEDCADYINANYIDGYNKQKKYIATQGPMPTTIDDFWRMVWFENCGKIVMLTNVLENSKIKCHQYWPTEPDNVLTSWQLEIRIEKSLHRSNYALREFKLKNIKSHEERRVLHFHYVTWPDHGVPSAPCLISFWKAVNRTPVSLNGPVIVHCSAGVGRTGTFLGLDILISEAKDKDKVDIFKCVSAMRANRVNMIQTREQYVFLHYVVNEAFRAKKSLFTVNELEKGRKMGELVPSKTIKQEFTNIGLLRKQISVMKTQAGRDQNNLMKNRSTSILPHDSHRVFLVTNVESRNDYIMAYMVPSLYKRDGFISTQLPLESTVIDFWRMVYEYNSLTIVSLVGNISSQNEGRLEGIASYIYLPTDKTQYPLSITDGNIWFVKNLDLTNFVNIIQKKYIQAAVSYWPCDSEVKTEAGPFTVHYKNQVTWTSFYKQSVLEVEKTDAPDPSIKSTVHMFSVTDWPIETLVPDKKGMLNLIEAIRSRQKQEGRHTIVVQDFDGASKCNVFCAVMNSINRLQEDGVLDVFLSVREIMTIQPNCFHNPKEYEFCYEMVKEYMDIEFIKKNLS